MTKGSNKGIKEGKGQRIENANYHCSNISLSAKNFADKGLRKLGLALKTRVVRSRPWVVFLGAETARGRETKK